MRVAPRMIHNHSVAVVAADLVGYVTKREGKQKFKGEVMINLQPFL